MSIVSHSLSRIGTPVQTGSLRTAGFAVICRGCPRTEAPQLQPLAAAVAQRDHDAGMSASFEGLAGVNCSQKRAEGLKSGDFVPFQDNSALSDSRLSYS